MPCIGTVPTWGASEGTGRRPFGPGAPWAYQRQRTRTHACSRTPRVGPLHCWVTSVSLSGDCAGAGWSALAVCAEPPLWALAEPRASRVPSSDDEVVEEPQNRRTRMSLGTKGLKVNLFPGLSPSALKVPSDPSTTHPASSHLASSVSSVRPSLPPSLHPLGPPSHRSCHFALH